jgi:hypothetical protein
MSDLSTALFAQSKRSSTGQTGMAVPFSFFLRWATQSAIGLESGAQQNMKKRS